MRISLLLITVLLCIRLDSLSKINFDDYAWQQYCYQNSPYTTSVVIADTIESLRPIGACSTDIRSGGDFYASVYKDIYTPVIGEYLGFKLSYNQGVAFSLPLRGLLLQFITFFLILGLLVYYGRIEYPKNRKLLDFGYMLVISGALCHGYERIVNGYVVDFISVKYFAIFNFADIFISVGFGLIVLSYFLYERKRNR